LGFHNAYGYADAILQPCPICSSLARLLFPFILDEFKKRGCGCHAKEIGADMRFSRLVIGVLVVLVALWVIVSEQMAGASADAVVNAQVVVVRTPIAGTLRDAGRGLGSAVSAGDALATVVDPMPDAVRLDDLVLQRELAEIRRSVQEARKTYLEQELERQTQRSTQYRDLSVQDLTARLAEARERLRHLVEAISPTDEITLSRAREEARGHQSSDHADRGREGRLYRRRIQ
jgi:multidrug resistance efflux pump